MAQTIYCDFCTDSKPADVMLTNLNDGQVDAYCMEHLGSFILETASKMVDAEQAMTAAETPQETAAEPDKADSPVKGKRSTGAKTETKGETVQ